MWWCYRKRINTNLMWWTSLGADSFPLTRTNKCIPLVTQPAVPLVTTTPPKATLSNIQTHTWRRDRSRSSRLNSHVLAYTRLLPKTLYTHLKHNITKSLALYLVLLSRVWPCFALWITQSGFPLVLPACVWPWPYSGFPAFGFAFDAPVCPIRHHHTWQHFY